MLPRPRSEESLSTLVASSATSEDDVRSILTHASEETLATGHLTLFGNRLLTFTRIRELPIVTGLLTSEIALYPSVRAVKDGSPLFTLQLNKFHFLKKNAPLLTVYIHTNGKEEYCKVYFKILFNNLTCFVLMFRTGENLVLFNNALKPCCDAIYQGSKIRIFGTSGAASAFGTGLIKAFALSDSSPVLADGLDLVLGAKSIKDVRISFDNPGPLYDAVVRQDKSAVLQLQARGKPLVNVPFASYTDHGKEKMEGVKVDGSIRLFESVNGDGDEQISPQSLVISSVLLVLVDQEIRKMRGNNKPSYIRGSE